MKFQFALHKWLVLLPIVWDQNVRQHWMCYQLSNTKARKDQFLTLFRLDSTSVVTWTYKILINHGWHFATTNPSQDSIQDSTIFLQLLKVTWLLRESWKVSWLLLFYLFLSSFCLLQNVSPSFKEIRLNKKWRKIFHISLWFAQRKTYYPLNVCKQTHHILPVF